MTWTTGRSGSTNSSAPGDMTDLKRTMHWGSQSGVLAGKQPFAARSNLPPMLIRPSHCPRVHETDCSERLVISQG